MNDIVTRLSAAEKTLNTVLSRIETLKVVANEITDEPRFTKPLMSGLKLIEHELKQVWQCLTGKER